MNFWKCKHTWKVSANNTKWCLIGCAIGDFATIAFFQFTNIDIPILLIMTLAVINGLITSMILEIIILLKSTDMTVNQAMKTAFNMSFISMIAMETAMNTTDFVLTGGAILNWWVVPIALFIGFMMPWPYNYWRLKKYGVSCH